MHKNIFFCLFLILVFISCSGCNNSTIIDLTKEQKIHDFNFLFDVLESSYPLFEYQEKVYGINWLKNKEKYLKMINATTDNFEFYATLDSIFSELPSIHTMLLEPSIEVYNSLNCFFDNDIKKENALNTKTREWNKYIKSYEKENRILSSFCFEYIEGQYVLNYYSSENIDWKIPYGTILKKINNKDVIDFYKENPSIVYYKYDSFRNNVYKSYAMFNFERGEEVDLEIMDTSSNTSIIKAFYSLVSEELANWLPNEYSRFFPDNSINLSFYIKYFEGINTAYVNLQKIDNNTYKAFLKNIDTINGKENLIIDLRNNLGGNPKLFINFILSLIGNENCEVKREWYVKDSEINKNILSSLSDVIIEKKTDNIRDSGFYVVSEAIKKNQIIKNFKVNRVLILVNNRSASATDTIINYIKNNNLSIIIGANTLGEGMSGSFAAVPLPNSGLVFTFMPGLSFNADGSCNSCVGTYPDIWAEQSIEDSVIKWDMLSEGLDVNDISNIMKYDTALKVAISVIIDK